MKLEDGKSYTMKNGETTGILQHKPTGPTDQQSFYSEELGFWFMNDGSVHPLDAFYLNILGLNREIVREVEL